MSELDLEAAPECSRDQEEVATAKPAETTTTIKCIKPETTTTIKCILVGISVLLAINIIFSIYYVATMLDRVECLIGNNNTTILPAIVWFTTWTLITTTVNWFVYLKRRYFLHQQSDVDDDSSTSSSTLSTPTPPPVLPTPLFHLCLPLSVTVMLAFTFYLVSNDWGRDFVDDELCYTLMDGAIPKDLTSQTGAAIFLTLDRLANFTAHYVCAAINGVLYWKVYMHEQGNASSWGWTLFPFIFIVVQGILVVVVDEFVDEVYDTDSIYVSVAVMLLIFFLTSAACFYRRKHSKE